MMLLDGFIIIAVLMTLTFWIIPVIMFIAGLVNWKKEPDRAKMLLIISGIWLIIGLSFCGVMLS